MNTELLMKRCLELAALGNGHTAPNPMVGALLWRDGRIVAEGWHHQHGGPHAEVDCLNNVQAGDRHLIPGATMFVNLEPCAHHGKTPPCAHRLVAEGIKEVIVCNRDPFKDVNGKGIKILKDAGINVQTGVCEKDGLWLNRRFFCFHTRQRPYVILKWAQTADGFIAPADRSRMQLTNYHSQLLVHKWRTEEAAIVVGATTAQNDDPALTARLWTGKQPLRIAINRNLDLPTSHLLLDNHTPTWLLNEQRNGRTGNTHFIQLNFNELLLPQLLALLHQHQILSLIVEGGAQLLQSFINDGRWDEARIFTAPKCLEKGIRSPCLTNARLRSSVKLEGDHLQVFTNSLSETWQ